MITIRDLLEQGVELQGNKIKVLQFNENTEKCDTLLDIDYRMFYEYEIECRNKGYILDWEITYIYPKDNDLIVEIKGE